MILGHYAIKKLVESGDLVVKPLEEETIREAGLDLRTEDDVLIKSNSPALIVTKEWVELPASLIGFCNLRSTYARQGLVIPPTVVDPGFQGKLVIGIMNANDHDVKLPKDTRFLHLILSECRDAIPYKGQYQRQTRER